MIAGVRVGERRWALHETRHGLSMIVGVDVDGYLRRLRLSRPEAPTVDALFALHRAHVTHVPYETLEIALGRPTTVDPEESIARIVGGRGGYCFHLNGAFGRLLEELGFEVTRHMGGVFGTEPEADGVLGGHLVLTVRVGGESWYVDAGLGDGLFEPMPLRAGAATQGRFTYRLEPSPLLLGGWRFRHSPLAGSFAGMEFSMEPAAMSDFVSHHARLSTSPDSNFVRVTQVGHRNAAGLAFMRGVTLRLIDASGRRDQVLTSADEWFGVVRSRFGMTLHDVSPEQRRAVWSTLWAGHLDYVASR